MNHNGTSAVEGVAADYDGDDVVVEAAVDIDDGDDNDDRATSHSKEDSDGSANDLADAEVKVGTVVAYDDDHHVDDGPLPEFHMTAGAALDDLAPRPFLPVEQKFHLQEVWWCCYQDGDIEAPTVLDASSAVGYHFHLMAVAETRQPLPRCPP